jgi:hypothetical protein
MFAAGLDYELFLEQKKIHALETLKAFFPILHKLSEEYRMSVSPLQWCLKIGPEMPR